MSSTDRRSFLKKGAALSASLTAAGLYPRRTFAQGSSKFRRIAYRQLGSTGYKVSEVGFGAMNTRDPELIHAAIDSGINYIDTAHGYMKGVNEEIVGKVMKTKRDKVFLVTKVYWREKTAKQLREMMELSLKRLQLDYVDTMYLHIVSKRETVINEDFMNCFEKARKDGVCRYVGVSTHSNQAEVLDAAVESKFWEHVLVGYNYTASLDPAVEMRRRVMPDVTPAIERARKAGLAIIGMKTQVKGAGFPDHNMGDMTVNQAALKWVLRNPYVDTTIPGMTAFEHIDEDMAVMGMRLSFHENRTLKRYSERLQGNYCRGVAGCTGCFEQCPKGVEVCELNRCLGYANGYGNVELARENYDQLPASSRVDVCDDCDECLVRCVNGIDLNDTVRRARELFA